MSSDQRRSVWLECALFVLLSLLVTSVSRAQEDAETRPTSRLVAIGKAVSTSNSTDPLGFAAGGALILEPNRLSLGLRIDFTYSSIHLRSQQELAYSRAWGGGLGTQWRMRFGEFRPTLRASLGPTVFRTWYNSPSSVSDAPHVRRTDWTVTIGAGIPVSKRLILESSYSWSLNQQAGTHTYPITLGYKF